MKCPFPRNVEVRDELQSNKARNLDGFAAGSLGR